METFKVYNTETGERLDIDPKAARLARLQRRIYAWAKTLDLYLGRLGRGYRLVMVTLTYAEADAWRPNHIREFMLNTRKILGSKLLAYAWIAELQQRGAVHYHVLLLVKSGTLVPLPDKAGLWSFGMSRVETARTVYYVVKYSGKEYQKSGMFPKGMRMFAVWIGASVVNDFERWFFRISSLPRWLRDLLSSAEKYMGLRPKRAKGGGWWVGEELHYSPWEVLPI